MSPHTSLPVLSCRFIVSSISLVAAMGAYNVEKEVQELSFKRDVEKTVMDASCSKLSEVP